MKLTKSLSLKNIHILAFAAFVTFNGATLFADDFDFLLKQYNSKSTAFNSEDSDLYEDQSDIDAQEESEQSQDGSSEESENQQGESEEENDSTQEAQINESSGDNNFQPGSSSISEPFIVYGIDKEQRIEDYIGKVMPGAAVINKITFYYANRITASTFERVASQVNSNVVVVRYMNYNEKDLYLYEVAFLNYANNDFAYWKRTFITDNPNPRGPTKIFKDRVRSSVIDVDSADDLIEIVGQTSVASSKQKKIDEIAAKYPIKGFLNFREYVTPYNIINQDELVIKASKAKKLDSGVKFRTIKGDWIDSRNGFIISMHSLNLAEKYGPIYKDDTYKKPSDSIMHFKDTKPQAYEKNTFDEVDNLKNIPIEIIAGDSKEALDAANERAKALEVNVVPIETPVVYAGYLKGFTKSIKRSANPYYTWQDGDLVLLFNDISHDGIIMNKDKVPSIASFYTFPFRGHIAVHMPNKEIRYLVSYYNSPSLTTLTNIDPTFNYYESDITIDSNDSDNSSVEQDIGQGDGKKNSKGIYYLVGMALALAITLFL